MSFDDEEKRKEKMRLVKTVGILMAIGFMVFAAYLKEIGPLIGLDSTFYSSQMIKYAFFATGIIDIIMFTFVIK